MSTLMNAKIVNVHLTDTHVYAHFDDGRVVGCPIVWFKNLRRGTVEQRETFTISTDGESVHWPLLDEDLSAEGFFTFVPKGIVVL